ncbi:CPBP family intramembrane glutamic endopeptidase [Streptococcus marmotae]|uniref:CPBP family intramembrane glutamic endopeptidase n=1 Tax=Streptococcus marmotae TaxID=1825069 RepID=UPI000830E175|nr:type II CAAX endopeptidase family protein [Streptococcus marmotae]
MKKILIRIVLWFLALYAYLNGAGLLTFDMVAHQRPDIPAEWVERMVPIFGVIGLVFLTAMSYLYWKYVYSKKDITIELPKPWMSNILYPIGLFLLVLVGQQVLPVPPSNNQQLVEQSVLSQPLFSFFAVVVFAPIMEELLFRGVFAGYFFPTLTKKISIIFYLFLSSGLFCLAHGPRTLSDFLIYFTMGVSLGWLYLAKRDLRYSVGLHFANNLLSFVTILL